MTTVPTNEYPANRPWSDKAYSIPNIPRGGGMVAILRTTLTNVRNNCPPTRIIIKDGNRNFTLDQLCILLRPVNLVEKTPTGWALSKDSARWLENGDNLYLASILCANVKFAAEILFYLNIPRKASELYEIAVRDYGLTWKTRAPLIVRLLWLKECGLLEYRNTTKRYYITETGRQFLNHVEIMNPTQIDAASDETADETIVPVAEWALEQCRREQKNLAARHEFVGYIPGKVGDMTETITDYLALIAHPDSDFSSLCSYAMGRHNIAPMKLKSFLTTLSNLGLIEQRPDAKYSVTPIAEKWLGNGGMTEMVCCFHSNFLFIAELLHEINGKNLTYNDMAKIAAASYGFGKENIHQIKKRLDILRAAKLVRLISISQNNIKLTRFTLTERGKRLLKLLPLQTNIPVRRERVSNHDFLFTKLRMSSENPSDPLAFAESVAEAFKTIGFSTNIHGTDILITASGIPEKSFSALVHPQTTTKETLTKHLIDFDDLKARHIKYEADFSVIIASAFNDNLIYQASKHGVYLLTVDDLIELTQQQAETPIHIVAFQKIFDEPGLVKIDLLGHERKKVVHTGNMLRDVMNCLLATNKNGATGKYLTASDIYWTIRNADVRKRLYVKEIEAALDFLASPYIGCAKRTPDGYCAAGTMSDLARGFAYYAHILCA